MIGHCSNCYKIWTLETRQGVCQWCGQPAICQTKRTQALLIKSRSNGRKRQAHTNGNGYDQLDGEWHDWLEVAKRYEHRVPAPERYDIRHTIIVELHHARQRDGEPIPILRAYRIASLTVALYWRRLKRQPTILSLDQPTTDYDGNESRLLDTVADDKAIEAIDLDAGLDAKQWLLGCRVRLIEIATKKLDGIPLNKKDQKYLERYRKRYQLALV